MSWQCAVERPISVKAMNRALTGALPTLAPGQIAEWLDVGQGGPVARAATTLETVLAENPREEATALILADSMLAQAPGWKHVVPLLASGLKYHDLRKKGAALRLTCHRVVTASTAETTRLAGDLARRAARLTAVAPKLRAKGAGAALFLTRHPIGFQLYKPCKSSI